MTERGLNTQGLWPRSGYVLILTLLGPSVGLGGEVSVNGRLEKIGPFRLLRVWGTPEEMGYAHGYLVGSEFVDGYNAQLAALPPEEREQLDTDVAPLLRAIKLPKSSSNELQGIFRGIEAAEGKVPTLSALNRELRVSDLVLFNAGDMTRGFQCSGFTVWGERAGDSGVITGRNFDYGVLYPKAVDDQLVLVRQPNERHQVATITWPGYIGAFTGVSDVGVCTFMHDGHGRMMTDPAGQYTPVALVLKDILESSDAANALQDATQRLRFTAPYPFSYLVRIVTPRVAQANYKPARVFRIDAGGLSQNPIGNGTCITTNHYLNASYEPAENAGKWSLTRYERLKKRLTATIMPQQAWEALGSVSSSNEHSGTLHSIVVYPERREIDLGFGRLEATKVIPATAADPTRISFSDLFAGHS